MSNNGRGGTLHLNIPGAGDVVADGAFFQTFMYGSEDANGRMTIPVPSCRHFWFDNHGATPFQVDIVTMLETYTVLLDGHDRLSVAVGPQARELTFTNLQEASTPVSPVSGNWLALSNPPDTGPSDQGFVAITGAGGYFDVQAPARYRPATQIVFPGGTQWPVSVSGMPVVSLADPRDGSPIDSSHNGALLTQEWDPSGHVGRVQADGSRTVQALFNPGSGQYEAQRASSVLKSSLVPVSVAPGGVGLWTPASGKRIRLLGGWLAFSVSSTMAAGYNLMDGAATIMHIDTPADTPFPLSLPPNGWLLSAANNVLGLNGPAATANYTLFGTEE